MQMISKLYDTFVAAFVLEYGVLHIEWVPLFTKNWLPSLSWYSEEGFNCQERFWNLLSESYFCF
jgi:hypothetical protein